jgi:SAM-dependent methyltransferase
MDRLATKQSLMTRGRTVMSEDLLAAARPVAHYAFDNDAAEAVDQLRLLGLILDPQTFATLTAHGVALGWDCWDVGSGGGSVAAWLADRVGASGYVLATDIKPQHGARRANMSVERHDLSSDPLPERKFDLIHARLLLMHLPERERLIHHLCHALKPTGVLIVSDWEISHLDLVLNSPDRTSADLFRKFLDAILIGSRGAGVDPSWASRMHRVFESADLCSVSTTVSARSWRGGTAGCLLHRSNSIQLRSRLLDLGFSEADLARLQQVLLDPQFVASSYLMYTTTGRRRE